MSSTEEQKYLLILVFLVFTPFLSVPIRKGEGTITAENKNLAFKVENQNNNFIYDIVNLF